MESDLWSNSNNNTFLLLKILEARDSQLHVSTMASEIFLFP